MSTTRVTHHDPALGTAALTRDQSRAVFGEVMGLVAITVGFTALGAYIGRNLSGGAGLLFFIAVFGCVIGLNAASSRGHAQLSIALLFGLGLLHRPSRGSRHQRIREGRSGSVVAGGRRDGGVRRRARRAGATPPAGIYRAGCGFCAGRCSR